MTIELAKYVQILAVEGGRVVPIWQRLPFDTDGLLLLEDGSSLLLENGAPFALENATDGG